MSHSSKWVKSLGALLLLMGRPLRWMEPRPQIRCFSRGVGVLHSPIIVGSCLLMTRSSSTANHYPGCSTSENVPCEEGGGASPRKEFVLERGNEMRLKRFSVQCFKKPARACVGMGKKPKKQNTRGIPKAEYGRAIKQSNVCASVNLLHAQLCLHTCESVTLCMCVVISVWIYTVLNTTLVPTNPSPWARIQSFLGMSRKELKWRHGSRSQGQFVEPRFNQRKMADNSRPDADFYYFFFIRF